MWIKFTAEYIAGCFAGAGLAIFFLGISAQSDLVSPEFLNKSGCLFAGLALLIGGGAMKLRLQGKDNSQES